MSDNVAIVFAVSIFITFSASMIVGGIIQQNYHEKEAISRGYGLYCPADGKFAWVGECDEK